MNLSRTWVFLGVLNSSWCIFGSFRLLVEYDYLKCRKMLYEATRYTAIATLDPTPTGPPRGELGVQDVLGAGVRGRGELGQRWHLPAVRARYPGCVPTEGDELQLRFFPSALLCASSHFLQSDFFSMFHCR